MKRFAVLALALAVASGCSSTEKNAEKRDGRVPGPMIGDINTGGATGLTPAGAANASNIQQAGAVVPQRSTGTTGTGSYLISGPRPATGGADCNH